MSARLCLILALFASAPFAFAGHENDGGNLTVSEFIVSARAIHARLAAATGDDRLLSIADLTRFAEAIDDTRVEPMKDPFSDSFGQPADARVVDNDRPGSPLKIQIWEAKWQNFFAVQPLRNAVYVTIFHEYLRVMGFPEDQQAISTRLKMGSTGALPSLPKSGQNMSFETAGSGNDGLPLGWYRSGNGQIALIRDTAVKRDGDASIRIESTQTSWGAATQCLPADDFRGRVVRYGGYLKTWEVKSYAGLWIRADGPFQQVLFFDNMANRNISGTNDWKRYETGGFVPESATIICFGALVSGYGAVWADGLELKAD